MTTSNPVEHAAKATADTATKGVHAAEHVTKANAETMTKGVHAAEHVAKANADAMGKGVHAAEHAAKTNVDTMTKTGNAKIAGFQELANAYQALAAKNLEKLTAAVQALSTVKTPVEFFALQKKLITEGVNAAISDSEQISKLTTSVFTAALQPGKFQINVL